MGKNWDAIEVIAKHQFQTYEDWWRWENERLRNGTSVLVERECDECDQLTIIERES